MLIQILLAQRHTVPCHIDRLPGKILYDCLAVHRLPNMCVSIRSGDRTGKRTYFVRAHLGNKWDRSVVAAEWDEVIELRLIESLSLNEKQISWVPLKGRDPRLPLIQPEISDSPI